MIKRIVRMSFDMEKVSTFIEIFQAAKPFIESMEGCQGVTLFRDADNLNVLYTESYWLSSIHLEMYRTSTLFEETWTKTKHLFNDKPLAFSLIAFENNNNEKHI
jgi:hypothetical protein